MPARPAVPAAPARGRTDKCGAVDVVVSLSAALPDGRSPELRSGWPGPRSPRCRRIASESTKEPWPDDRAAGLSGTPEAVRAGIAAILHGRTQKERPGHWVPGAFERAAGQEALGTAIDSDGVSELPPVDGATLGRVVVVLDVGVVVAAGELQAETAPATDTARARLSRMRLNIGSGSSGELGAAVRRLAVAGATTTEATIGN